MKNYILYHGFYSIKVKAKNIESAWDKIQKKIKSYKAGGQKRAKTESITREQIEKYTQEQF